MKQTILILAMLLATSAYGDSIVDATSTECDSCLGVQLPTVNFSGEMDVAQVSGEFFDPAIDTTAEMTVDEVMSLAGTLNGQQVSLTTPQSGAGDWLSLNTFNLGLLCMESAGTEYCFENDDAFNLLEPNGEPVTWAAIDPIPTPEPNPNLFIMLALVLTAATLTGWARGRWRKS
jgi:hypothetical protein